MNRKLDNPRARLLASAVALLAAAPALGGFDADKVALHAQITLGEFGASFAEDCWGYVSESGREYAIIGLSTGTGFVEITDPDNPVIVDVVNTPNRGRDMKVYQHYVYSSSDNGPLNLFDVSDIDNGNIVYVDSFDAGTHNLDVNADSATLYLAIGGPLVALDISDPEDPVFAGIWEGEAHDVQVITYPDGEYAGREIAFICAGWEQALVIVDVTNKANMFLVGQASYPNAAYAHQGWLSDDRQHFYLNDELDDIQRASIFDVSDLSNPQYLGDFSSNADDATDHNLYMRDGFIFAANYTSGLRVFDACDPVNPVEVGYFDTYAGGGPGFDGAWSNYPFFPSRTVIISDRNNGLFIVDVSEAVGGGCGGVACADDGTLIEGTGEINDFNAACGSDNTYWAAHGEVFAFQVSDPVVQFELTATAPSGFGGTISVDIEASKQSDNGNLTIRPQLFNFATGDYVALGAVGLTTTDVVSNLALPGGSDPADFIENGTNEVSLLIEVIQSSGVPNVRTQLDEVLFNFE